LSLELAKVHEHVAGAPAELSSHPAWPDMPVFTELGIPAVTYGPMGCYWDDEFFEVDEYLTAVKTYCVAALALAG
jgi:acetylornithine deacetylase/succinyl-diaminopimelate desuccinylase-like protein